MLTSVPARGPPEKSRARPRTPEARPPVRGQIGWRQESRVCKRSGFMRSVRPGRKTRGAHPRRRQVPDGGVSELLTSTQRPRHGSRTSGGNEARGRSGRATPEAASPSSSASRCLIAFRSLVSRLLRRVLGDVLSGVWLLGRLPLSSLQARGAVFHSYCPMQLQRVGLLRAWLSLNPLPYRISPDRRSSFRCFYEPTLDPYLNAPNRNTTKSFLERIGEILIPASLR